jgi:hypothetical protein
VQAEHLAIEQGQVTATGGVTMTRDGQTIAAETAVFLLDDQVLVLTGGTLTRGELVLSFEHATVRIRAEEALLSGVVAEGLGWHLQGTEVLVHSDGSLTLLQAEATGCDAAPGQRVPWELQARQADLVPGTSLQVRGGIVRFFGVPLLPVPYWFTRLDPHEPHLEAPVLAWVDGHGAARFPVRWGHPSGLTMRASLGYWRGPSTDIQASWSEASQASTEAVLEEGRGRGRIAVDHAWVNQDLRFGVHGQLVSDSEWLPERGRTLAERSAPWTDVRAIGGFGPLRLELTGYQFDAPQVSWIPAVVLSSRTQDLGPFLASGTARFDLVDDQLRSEAMGGVRLVHRWEILETDLRVDARALAYESTDGGLDVSGRWELRIPLWREGVLGRQEWVLGARVEAGRHWGPEPLFSWEAWDTGLRVGPVLQTVAWSAGAAHAWAEVWIPWDQETFAIEGAGRLAWGPLTLGGQAHWREGEGLMAGQVGWAGMVGGVWGALALAGGEDEAVYGRLGGWAELGGQRNSWGITGNLMGDEEGVGEAELGLEWRSGCDCMVLGSGVGWARDQAGGRILVRVDLTP